MTIHSGYDGTLISNNAFIHSTKCWSIQARFRKTRIGTNAEVFEGNQEPLYGEPLSLFRVQPKERELRTVQAQPWPL